MYLCLLKLLDASYMHLHDLWSLLDCYQPVDLKISDHQVKYPEMENGYIELFFLNIKLTVK